jgi:quercetin dioxygenase-like cupin family protein
MSVPSPIRFDLLGGTDYQPLLTGRPQSCGMRSGCVSLKPGGECGKHSTGSHEEVLVILEGAGTALIPDGEALEVRAGQVLYIPPHTEHNMAGGETGLRYVFVVAPVGEAVSERGK